MHTHPSASARLAVVNPLAQPRSALIRSIAAATLVAAILRIFRIGHQSLWVDEVFTWARSSVGTLRLQDLLEDVHGPLYTLGLHLWTGVAGESEWALRAPSALAGVLSVPAMAWLAHRWLGRSSAGIAAWLTAGSPFLVWYSQETRNYAWLILWAIVSVACLLEMQRRAGVPAVVRVFVALAGGLFTNFAFALMAPVQLRLWLGGERSSRRWRLVALVATGAVIVVLALPWLRIRQHLGDWGRLAPGHVQAAGEVALRGATTFHPAAVPFALHAFAVGYTLGPSLRELKLHPGTGTVTHHLGELLATGIVFGALGILGVMALARRRRLADAFLWFVAPVLLVSYFASHNVKVFHPRYVAVALPCMLLAFAAALADMRPAVRRVFGAGIAVLWAVSLYHHYFVPEYAREDYRGALAMVRATAAPGEQVVAVGAPDPVEFYGRGLRVGRWWLGFVATPGRMQERFAELLSRADGTWIVLSRGEDLDPGELFPRWLSSRYPHAGHWTYTGVRVWHITRQDAGAVTGAARLPASAP